MLGLCSLSQPVVGYFTTTRLSAILSAAGRASASRSGLGLEHPASRFFSPRRLLLVGNMGPGDDPRPARSRASRVSLTAAQQLHPLTHPRGLSRSCPPGQTVLGAGGRHHGRAARLDQGSPRNRGRQARGIAPLSPAASTTVGMAPDQSHRLGDGPAAPATELCAYGPPPLPRSPIDGPQRTSVQLDAAPNCDSVSAQGQGRETPRRQALAQGVEHRQCGRALH